MPAVARTAAPVGQFDLVAMIFLLFTSNCLLFRGRSRFGISARSLLADFTFALIVTGYSKCGARRLRMERRSPRRLPARAAGILGRKDGHEPAETTFAPHRDSVITTSVEKMAGGRRSAIWPVSFGLAGCA